MLFKLKDVFMTEGTKQSLEYSLNMSELELNGTKPFVKPVFVSAVAENRAGLITLRLNARYIYVSVCDRCGTDISPEFDQSFTHYLVTSLSGDSDDEYIETPDYELELDDLVTADIILELPSKLLCREDCKGICSTCGKSLNNGDCSCKHGGTDPRFEVLKQLLD